MNDFFKNQNGSNDLANVMKLFYEYFKIYKQATQASVSKWKMSDVENAIKWSQFIEELHSKFISKAYYEKLLVNLKHLALNWSINAEEVEEIVKNPTFSIRNVRCHYV